MKRIAAVFVVVVLSVAVLDVAIAWQSTGSLRGYSFFSAAISSDERALRWRTVAFFIAMLAGVVCGEFHRQAITRGGTAGILRATFRSTRLIAGLAASPIVFGVVYVLCRAHPDALLAGLLSFENGFFWNTVLGRRETELASGGSRP